MSYTIEYDDSADMVRTCVVGEVDADLTRQFVKEAVSLARSHECNAFLFDAREADVPDSTMVIFGLAAGLDALGQISKEDRIAVVFAGQADDSDFAETVAKNRGWPSFRYFPELKEAEEWLKNRP